MVRKIIFLLTMFMVMFSSIFAASILGPSIQIVQSSISPDPVKPGNDLTLKFDILNLGDENSQDVSINMKSSEVFYFKDSDFNKENFAICGGCSYDATYYFSVKSGVSSGIYPITFDVFHDGGQITTQTINVKVEGVPDILIVNDNLNEKKLYPSEEFNLVFNLENFGTGIAKNIKVSSDFGSIIKVGTSVDYIDELGINDKNEIINKFKIDENLDPGLYQIPFMIEFEDDFGSSYSKDYTIGIEILNKAKINIQYLKLGDYQVNLFKDVEINGMIENIGFGEAQNVYVEVETDLEGFKKSFVGLLISLVIDSISVSIDICLSFIDSNSSSTSFIKSFSYDCSFCRIFFNFENPVSFLVFNTYKDFFKDFISYSSNNRRKRGLVIFFTLSLNCSTFLT